MTTLIQSGSIHSVQQVEYGEPLFELIADPQVQSSSSASSTYKGSDITVHTTASYWNHWIIVPKVSDLTFSYVNAGVADISDNYISRIQDGIVVVTSQDGTAKSIATANLTVVGGGSITTFNGYSEGGTAKLLADNLLSAFSFTGGQDLFSSKNHLTGSFVRNTSNALSSLDLSGVAVSLSLDGGTTWMQNNAPVAITGRHGILVRHYGYDYANAKIRFIKSDNTQIVVSVIGVSSPLKNGGTWDDLVVVTFNSDVSAFVSVLPVCGEWFRTDLVDSGLNVQFAASFWSGGYGFFINQNYLIAPCVFGSPMALSNSAVVRNITYNESVIDDVPTQAVFLCGANLNAICNNEMESLSDYFLSPVTGDSGKPIFCIIDGTPHIVGLFTTPVNGPFIGALDGSVVNAMIANADSSAGVSTGLTATIASDPTS